MARDPRDFYATPQWCVTELYKKLPSMWPEPTLDPCAGTGALVQASRALGHLSGMHGVEKDADLLEEAGRFLPLMQGCGLSRPWTGEHILMNPPFRSAQIWVEKGLEEAESMQALVRLGFLASQARNKMFEKYPPQTLTVMSCRPSFTVDGKTDRYDYVWVGWARTQVAGAAISWIMDPKRVRP